MEQNHCIQRYVAAAPLDIPVAEIKCVKRNDSCFEEPPLTQRPCLPRHSLHPNFARNAAADDLRVGFLYEIDHKQLPPKSPIQLKSIRAVMVAEKNELNVSVRFPSTLALRTFFNSMNSQNAKKYPDLDEQFVMGIKLGQQVLVRQILPPEFQEQGRLRNFWLVPPKVTEPSTSITNGDSSGETSAKGLSCDGLLNWGVKRRITFKLKTPRVPSLSNLVKEEEDSQMVVKSKDCEPRRMVTRKRKRGYAKHMRNSKVVKRDESKAITTTRRKQKLKLSYDRWSQDRYKHAELKMLEIMKEKGAVIGRPMLRPELRTEARKHIGDTGLLDHLLKHMAGKVAPNGEDRFRRRHNADGAMEYWLESADLVNIRQEAGVNDSYWNPPPGWKPGDSLSQDPNCAKEVNLLKEQMASIAKDVQELLLWKRDQENGERAIVPFTKSSSENSYLESDSKALTVLEDYENLMKRKAELEQQLVQISESLKEMQEEMRRCGKRVVEEVTNSAMEATGEENDKRKLNEEEKKVEQEAAAAAAEASAKAARRERLRSGFRICKPQGTFLWPNMGGGTGTSSSCAGNSNVLSTTPPQVLVQVENLVMVPTPPSVTSATTTAPPLLLAPPQPASPVKPLPEKRPVPLAVSHSSMSSTCDQQQGGGGTGSISNNNSFLKNVHQNGFCGTPSSCSTYPRTFVLSPTTVAFPDINEAPRMEGIHSSSTTSARIYQTKQQQQQKEAVQHHQHEIQSPDAYMGRSWLALATPSTSLASDSLF